MRRRKLITMLGGTAVVWWLPAPARGQGARAAGVVPVIGLLSPFSHADTQEWHQAFRQGLGDLGWVEGTNIRLEYRFIYVADGVKKLSKMRARQITVVDTVRAFRVSMTIDAAYRSP
jgi:hypothetical protein